MMEIQSILTIICISAGIFFMFVGSVGVIRLPDFYSRTHAVSKSDTLGISLVIVGLIIFEGFTQSSLKLGLVLLFVALSNPIGTHALGRAAYHRGIKPFFNGNNKNEPS
jgi:multicomponent Na+:H+ antiporter subunit G